MLKLIIAGGRDFADFRSMSEAMELYPRLDEITHVISGMARGADMMGRRWAKDHDIPVIEYPANWDMYGKRAGIIRNEEMGIEAHELVAFWDGKSRGTLHALSRAKRLKKTILLEKYWE